MTHSTKTHVIQVQDHPVSITEFPPQHSNQCSVLINSATGIRQQFYQAFAHYLTDRGYTVFTYDYRSIGQSKLQPLENYDVSFTNWGQEDYPAVARLMMRLHPEKKRFLIGHSIGGNCIGLSEVTNSFDGIITVGSHHGYLGHYPLHLQPYVYFKFAILMPLLSKWYGYTPNKAKRMGDNLPKKVAREWALTCRRRESLTSILRPEENFYHRIAQPMLMISIEDDLIAPKKGVEALRKVYYNARVTRRHIRLREVAARKIGHVNLFRRSFEPQWSIFTDWMDSIREQVALNGRAPLSYHYHQQLYDYLGL
ncbi:MAG: alpha/beta hydrolase [Saprospiraceae bacterium]|nr:alpha/beta hydrolase [Lewinella sp.]